MGSIIGAGWLFGALYASSLAGPAAIIAWLLGGSAMMLLALAHAELGSAYPVAGGNARFPHYAFGRLIGFTSGWVAFLGAVTVEPIMVQATRARSTSGWDVLAVALLSLAVYATPLRSGAGSPLSRRSTTSAT